MILAFGTAFGI